MRASTLAGGLFSMAALTAPAPPVFGDGSVVDKIYHPYVEQLEWELEWRMTHEDEDPLTGAARDQVHKLGLGHGVGEYLFIEAYLIGQRSADDDLDLYAYEVEVLWQLAEQGEYLLDYGLLFELEKEHGEDIWEYATTLLLEKELGRDVLCPVALDDSWKTCRWPERLREQIMEYNILDFSEWHDEVFFQRMFTKLIDGLDLFYKE